jgi:hypothetical protein
MIEKTNLNKREQKEILKTLSKLCTQYQIYKKDAFYSSWDAYPCEMRQLYRYMEQKTREAIIDCMTNYNLPLLKKWHYTNLRKQIKDIVPEVKNG